MKIWHLKCLKQDYGALVGSLDVDLNEDLTPRMPKTTLWHVIFVSVGLLGVLRLGT